MRAAGRTKAEKQREPTAPRGGAVGSEYGAPTRMARRLKIGSARWHDAKSRRGLSQNLTLILLEQIPGLSADWLLRGRPEGPSYEMARVLGVPDQTD